MLLVVLLRERAAVQREGIRTVRHAQQVSINSGDRNVLDAVLHRKRQNPRQRVLRADEDASLKKLSAPDVLLPLFRIVQNANHGSPAQFVIMSAARERNSVSLELLVEEAPPQVLLRKHGSHGDRYHYRKSSSVIAGQFEHDQRRRNRGAEHDG